MGWTFSSSKLLKAILIQKFQGKWLYLVPDLKFFVFNISLKYYLYLINFNLGSFKEKRSKIFWNTDLLEHS